MIWSHNSQDSRSEISFAPQPTKKVVCVCAEIKQKFKKSHGIKSI